MELFEKLWNAFNDISFDEPNHRYTDSKNTEYTSVTTWIEQFKPDENWEEKAMNSAIHKFKEEGIDVDSIEDETEKKETLEKIKKLAEETKKKWDLGGDYARHLGTQVHSCLELLWNRKNYDFDDRLNEQFPDMKEDFLFRKERCKELFKKLKNIYIPIANEFIVYDQENKLCGTIDFLAYNKKTNKYAIIDWKTSKKFSHGNYENITMKAPFEDVVYCNCAEYSLQLSTYKYILEKHTDIKIGEMILFQIPNKDNPMPQTYKCMDFSDRIKGLFKNG